MEAFGAGHFIVSAWQIEVRGNPGGPYVVALRVGVQRFVLRELGSFGTESEARRTAAVLRSEFIRAFGEGSRP